MRFLKCTFLVGGAGGKRKMAKKDAEPFGGHDHEFVGEVPDRFNCQICAKVIREPHLAVCCGQHFCESCLNKWFTRQGKESCPHCRAEGEGFHHVINKGLRSEINQLKIKCTNRKKGCEWSGELGSLKTHLESGKGCGFVIIDCPNKCRKSIFRKELKVHLESECTLCSYQCEHCGHKDTYKGITGKGLRLVEVCGLGATAKSHYDECPSYPLKCPNHCGVTGIKRKDMAGHRSKCPQERVECPFAEAGCKNTTLCRCTLDDHLSSNQQEHLLLVMGAYKQIKNQLRATEAKLTTAVQLLRQGGEADKEIIDSIVTCSPAYLKKLGDIVSVTMPRVSEYHRIGKAWRSAPFYINKGYKMCLVVSTKKMEAGVCTGVSVGICVLKGEHDDQLKWPIGSSQCMTPSRRRRPLAHVAGIPFTKDARLHICQLEQLTQTECILCSPEGSCLHLENDCITFTIRNHTSGECNNLNIAVECRWM